MAGVKNHADSRFQGVAQASVRTKRQAGPIGLMASVQSGLETGLAARLDESLALLEVVRRLLVSLGQQPLARLVCGAHRSDPRRGIRGSQLTIVASQHAAAAKLQLLAPSILQGCQSQSLGFQTIVIRSQRMVASVARPAASQRPAVPHDARQRLLAAAGLSQAQDH
jgi:hypothetical protein